MKNTERFECLLKGKKKWFEKNGYENNNEPSARWYAYHNVVVIQCFTSTLSAP